jgi:uncharacterized RDD family membrane protein YckC
MSEVSQGPGWWQASDGKWYPPQSQTPPSFGQPAYGYKQQGYGYSYGPASSYSGFWRRAGAALLDGLIVNVPIDIIGAGQLNARPHILLSNVIGVAYYAILEGTRGQTLGKMAVGIKVIDADTAGFIGVPRGIGRYFARFLSGIALGLGYLWMLWDPRKQCWHDKLVGSIVVRTS